MNHCGMQQKNALAGGRDEMFWGPFVPSERRETVFCPKPRRLATHLSVTDPIRPLCSPLSPNHQPDPCDSRSGPEVFDIILTKDARGGVDYDLRGQICGSPPFFCGSPPSRAANPLVYDARFREEKPFPLTPLPIIPMVSAATPSPAAGGARKGCARTKFGFTPATVRVEGFDCGNRRGHSIPAVA